MGTRPDNEPGKDRPYHIFVELEHGLRDQLRQLVKSEERSMSGVVRTLVRAAVEAGSSDLNRRAS